MTWVAVAIGGAAVIGAGTSAGMGLMQSNAAKEGSNLQFDALMQSLRTQTSTRDLMMQYFDPFRQMGLNAGFAMQSSLQSPDQLANSRAQQRLTMQSQLDALNQKYQQQTEGQASYFPVLTGPNASERRGEMITQAVSETRDQINSLQNQLSTFDKQTDLLKSQSAQTQQSGPFGDLSKNPIFNAQANAVERRLASQGLLGSRAAIEQEGSVAANTAQIMLGGLNNLYQPAVSGTVGLAGGIGQMGQSMAGTQAQGGQVLGQGVINASNALASGYSGAANSLMGGGSALLNYNLYNNMIKQLNTGGSANTALSGGVATAPGGVARGFDLPGGSGYDVGKFG